MEEPVDSKIFTPHIPKLSHLAVVKLALALLDNFKFKTLDKAFHSTLKGELIQLCNEPQRPKKKITLEYHNGMNSWLYIQMGMEKWRLENENTEERRLELIQCQKAQEKICQIDYTFRRRVMRAVHGLNEVSGRWKRYHLMLLKLPEDMEVTFYWRQDGALDEIKTAREIVINSQIDIVKRFRLACLYSLEENIKSLWQQMGGNGGIENLEIGRISMVRFWTGYLKDGCVVPWKKEVQRHFRYRQNRRGEVRFRTFLPSLPREERKMFIWFLKYAGADDLRTCTYSMSREEEGQLLCSDWCCPGDLLSSYLRWPMQSYFLETAEKMLYYINKDTFYRLLDDILNAMNGREDFDYADLFEKFWFLVPEYLREAMKEDYYSNVHIDKWYDEIRKKQRLSCDVEDKLYKKLKVEG